MPKRDYYLGSRKLVSQDDKAIIESPQVPRSRFTGEYSYKTTFDAGWLVPFLVEEILPGDHMSYDVTAYVRLSTPLFPLFDNQRIDTFFFFVPNRLLWVNWPKLMGEQDNPGDSIAYTVPQILAPEDGYASCTIFDYMDLPVQDSMPASGIVSHSALPLRAYNQIWNAWFRDQNVNASVVKETDDGPDLYTQYSLQKRAKSHDYFTSALPWPQKFLAPNPLAGGLAPVQGIGMLSTTATTGPQSTRESDQTVRDYAFYQNSPAITIEMSAASAAWPMVFADLSQATGVSINTFRQAFLVQTLLERDARGGSRYVESIRQHFGVTSPDFRLQRPEYIGGGQTHLNITPVAQTAPSVDLTVGALGAAGSASGQHRASYAATEHGYIIGLINVRTDIAYQQGIQKHWTRQTRYDFYVPALAGLGEQAILRKELYVSGVAATDDLVFGYQERWHEYRSRYSAVTGMFRSNITGTLDNWHLAQYFSGPPTLNSNFIMEDPPMSRVLAAGELAVGQQYLADLHIRRTAVRPIPTYGTPVTLGRF